MAWTTPGTATAGEVLTASFWNTQVRDNMLELYATTRRIGFQSRTTSFSASAASFAAASDIFTSITFTADGTSSYRVIFYGDGADTQATGRDLFISLNVSGTETGRTNIFNGAGRTVVPITIDRWITPAAGSRTINFRAYNGGGTTSISAGDGTSTNPQPMWMALYGPALT
jgi:hypothetical protein